jgi:hypothetical protein
MKSFTEFHNEEVEQIDEGVIDSIKRATGFAMPSKHGDTVRGGVVADYLSDNTGHSTKTLEEVGKSKYKLHHIDLETAKRHRDFTNKKVGIGGRDIIDVDKIERIRRRKVTYDSLVKHPPVIHHDGTILDGNHRIQRAIELKHPKIPVLAPVGWKPRGVNEAVELTEAKGLESALRKLVPGYGSRQALERNSAHWEVVNTLSRTKNEPEDKVRAKSLRHFRAAQKYSNILFKQRSLPEEVEKSTGDLKKACWKGYTAVGMKEKNGRKVPNCVPEEVETLDEISKDMATRYMKQIERQPGLDKDHPDKRKPSRFGSQKVGYERAFNKVSPYGKRVKVKATESVEHLDEAPAWQRKEGKNPEGGLNQKGVDSYRAENPGSKLQTAVTTEPSKLKKGSKAANRRLSFCRRMKGMKDKLTSAETARDPDSRINKSLRKWNC